MIWEAATLIVSNPSVAILFRGHPASRSVTSDEINGLQVLRASRTRGNARTLIVQASDRSVMIGLAADSGGFGAPGPSS